MTRPHYYRSIRDGSGAIRPHSTVALFEPGTSTPLAVPVYSGPIGMIERGSTWVAPDGIVDFYLELPQIVDILVSPPDASPVSFANQWVGDAENPTPEGLSTFGSMAGQAPVADGEGSWHWATLNASDVGAQPVMVRAQATLTTPTLAAGAEHSGVISMALGYRLYSIATDAPSRVRIYATAAHRAADAARPVGTDTTGDHGLILEFVTSPEVLSSVLSPFVDGANLEDPPSGDVPVLVSNAGTASSSVTVTLTYLRTE